MIEKQQKMTKPSYCPSEELLGTEVGETGEEPPLQRGETVLA